MPLKNLIRIHLTVIFAILVEGINLQAQELSRAVDLGPTNMVRGGAGVALPADLDSFTTNPANLIFSSGKGSLGGDWLKYPQSRDRWSVGLVDGRKQVIGGLKFEWYEEGEKVRRNYQLAATYATKYGAAGANIMVLEFDRLSRSDDDGWYFSQNAGVVVPLYGGFTIGVTGKYFLDRMPDRVQPPEMATGLSYNGGYVRAEFQADRRFYRNDQEWNFSAGGDLIMRQYFILRGGYHWDRSHEKNFWSIGGAIESPRLTLGAFYTRSDASEKRDGYGFNVVSYF